MPHIHPLGRAGVPFKPLNKGEFRPWHTACVCLRVHRKMDVPPTPRRRYMSKTRTTAAVLAIVGVIAGSFAVIGTAEAKRAKCTAVPVPGHPGTFVVTCST